MNALVRIRNQYKDFSKVNKQIADCILHEPASILSLTATDIAEKSQTSPASVIRFAKSLGFNGLDDLKLSIATQQGTQKNKKIVDPIISRQDSIDVLCEKVEALINSTMTDLLYVLDKQELEKAIAAIKKAETIYLLGIGASSLTTYNLYHKFNRAGRKAVFNFDAQMNIEFINYASEKDVVIAVSYSGKTKEVLHACETAKKNNCHTIFITKNDSQRIRELSNEILLVPDNEHIIRVGAISSVTSSMAVGDILYLGSIQDEIEESIEQKMIETNKLVNQFKED